MSGKNYPHPNHGIALPSTCDKFEVIWKSVRYDADDFVNNSYGDDDDDDYFCGCTPSVSNKYGSHPACCFDDNCVNFSTQIECISCDSKFCQNQRFQRFEYVPLTVKETPGKGHGLFTTGNIKKNMFVMEYVGELVSSKEILKRMNEYNGKHLYVMQLKPGTFLDARRKGSITRYINHSCEPNCTIEIWTIQGRLRVGIFTLCDIEAGMELSFDYQWSLSNRRRPTICACKTPSCRGYIEVTNKEEVDRMMKSNKDLMTKRGRWRTKEEAFSEMTIKHLSEENNKSLHNIEESSMDRPVSVEVNYFSENFDGKIDSNLTESTNQRKSDGSICVNISTSSSNIEQKIELNPKWLVGKLVKILREGDVYYEECSIESFNDEKNVYLCDFDGRTVQLNLFAGNSRWEWLDTSQEETAIKKRSIEEEEDEMGCIPIISFNSANRPSADSYGEGIRAPLNRPNTPSGVTDSESLQISSVSVSKLKKISLKIKVDVAQSILNHGGMNKFDISRHTIQIFQAFRQYIFRRYELQSSKPTMSRSNEYDRQRIKSWNEREEDLIICGSYQAIESLLHEMNSCEKFMEENRKLNYFRYVQNIFMTQGDVLSKDWRLCSKNIRQLIDRDKLSDLNGIFNIIDISTTEDDRKIVFESVCNKKLANAFYSPGCNPFNLHKLKDLFTAYEYIEQSEKGSTMEPTLVNPSTSRFSDLLAELLPLDSQYSQSNPTGERIRLLFLHMRGLFERQNVSNTLRGHALVLMFRYINILSDEAVVRDSLSIISICLILANKALGTFQVKQIKKIVASSCGQIFNRPESDYLKNDTLDYFMKKVASKESEILQAIGYDIFVPNPLAVIISYQQTSSSDIDSDFFTQHVLSVQRIEETSNICANIITYYPDLLSIYPYDVLLICCVLLHINTEDNCSVQKTDQLNNQYCAQAFDFIMLTSKDRLKISTTVLYACLSSLISIVFTDPYGFVIRDSSWLRNIIKDRSSQTLKLFSTSITTVNHFVPVSDEIYRIMSQIGKEIFDNISVRFDQYSSLRPIIPTTPMPMKSLLPFNGQPRPDVANTSIVNGYRPRSPQKPHTLANRLRIPLSISSSCADKLSMDWKQFVNVWQINIKQDHSYASLSRDLYSLLKTTDINNSSPIKMSDTCIRRWPTTNKLSAYENKRRDLAEKDGIDIGVSSLAIAELHKLLHFHYYSQPLFTSTSESYSLVIQPKSIGIVANVSTSTTPTTSSSIASSKSSAKSAETTNVSNDSIDRNKSELKLHGSSFLFCQSIMTTLSSILPLIMSQAEEKASPSLRISPWLLRTWCHNIFVAMHQLTMSGIYLRWLSPDHLYISQGGRLIIGDLTSATFSSDTMISPQSLSSVTVPSAHPVADNAANDQKKDQSSGSKYSLPYLSTTPPEIILGALPSAVGNSWIAGAVCHYILTGKPLAKPAASDEKHLSYTFKILGTPKVMGWDLDTYHKLPLANIYPRTIQDDSGASVESKNRLAKVLQSSLAPHILQLLSPESQRNKTNVTSLKEKRTHGSSSEDKSESLSRTSSATSADLFDGGYILDVMHHSLHLVPQKRLTCHQILQLPIFSTTKTSDHLQSETILYGPYGWGDQSTEELMALVEWVRNNGAKSLKRKYQDMEDA